MTVETTDSRVQYETNGTTGPWTVPFYFLADADLQVIYTDSSGSETTLVLTTNYSVTGASVPSGGTVTTVTAYPAGGTITISNEVEALQEVDYTETDSFPAETHERALDRLTMLAQRAIRTVARALKIPASDNTDMSLPGPASRALKVLGFNSVGAPVMLTRTDDGGSALALDLAAADAVNGSRIVGHLPSLTGAVETTVGEMLDRMFAVNILTMGAVAGTSDNTAAFELAAATGRAIYVPSGTWYCNATFSATQRIVMLGDGSRNSIIRPYNTALPAITHKAGGSFDYHSEYRNLGFAGTSKVGIGITFGSKSGLAADYVTNAELAGNVKFYGCNFTGLEKGVQFPNGNIGSEFYSCGFGGNKYGVYTINNKTGSGAGMHAGNKYFFGGEFHSNECAFYCDNSMDGFGGIAFRSTIFESNYIDFYLNNQTYVMQQPIVFDDVWFEDTVAGAAVTIDSWSGATLSTQSVARHRMVIDGTRARVNFEGGNFSDCLLNATYSQVQVRGARSERSSGVGGVNSVVASNTSNIHQIDCYGDLGPAVGYNIFSSGLSTVYRDVMETSAATDGTRWMTVRPRSNKTTGYGVSLVAGVTFTGVEAGTGSFAASGTVVAGGEIYATCNNFSRNNVSAGVEYFKITNSNVASTTANYWYVVTFDARVNGAIDTAFYVWDRSAVALAYAMTCPTKNRWYSFAALAQSTGGSNIYLDCALPVGLNDWDLSAFQIHKFPTLYEAQNFLASGVYCPS